MRLYTAIHVPEVGCKILYIKIMGYDFLNRFDFFPLENFSHKD